MCNWANWRKTIRVRDGTTQPGCARPRAARYKSIANTVELVQALTARGFIYLVNGISTSIRRHFASFGHLSRYPNSVMQALSNARGEEPTRWGKRHPNTGSMLALSHTLAQRYPSPSATLCSSTTSSALANLRLALMSRHYRGGFEWHESMLEPAKRFLCRLRTAVVGEAAPDPRPYTAVRAALR